MDPFREAEKIILSTPKDSISIDISNIGITDLTPLLPHLSKYKNLQYLNISNNNINYLPNDLSILSSLISINIKNNPINGADGVLMGLQSLKCLKHININLSDEDEELIIGNVISLESFNGTVLIDEEDEDDNNNNNINNNNNLNNNNNNDFSSLSPEKSYWKKSDTDQVYKLYTAANNITGRKINEKEFNEYTKHVLNHLETLIKTEQDPLRREAEILTAKKILFEYCFDEIVNNSSSFGKLLLEALTILQETNGGLIFSFQQLIKDLFEDKSKVVNGLKKEMQISIREVESLMAQLETRGNLNNNNNNNNNNNIGFENERKKYIEEINMLRAENSRLQTRLRLLDVTRGNSSGSTTFNNSTNINNNNNNNNISSNGLKSLISPNNNNNNKNPNNNNNNNNNNISSSPITIGTKVLTQKQLRDTIEEIYASKSKYDIKCNESQLPKETMEQHMYTFLNQKYGLRHIILEWATCIIKGIKKYSYEDNDISVFGKILRNEIDEEFRFVQRQLKETVHELLRVHIKGKYPLKCDDEINNIIKNKIKGFLYEDEWIDIIKYMYNNDDAVSLIMRVKDIIKQNNNIIMRRRGASNISRRGVNNNNNNLNNNNKTDSNINYWEFIKTLLDFQMEGHERFLSKFVQIFRQYDKDRNGILNEEDFLLFIKNIDPDKDEEEIASLLELIDPNNNQLISFSECVTFLSAELVKMAKGDN